MPGFKRIAPVAVFAAMSAALHAAVLLQLDFGASGGGEGGEALVSLQAAPEGYAALVADWTTPPDVAAEGPAQPIADLETVARPATPSADDAVAQTGLSSLALPRPPDTAPERLGQAPALGQAQSVAALPDLPATPSVQETRPRPSASTMAEHHVQDAPPRVAPAVARATPPAPASTRPLPRPTSAPQVARRASGDGVTQTAGAGRSAVASSRDAAKARALQAQWAGTIQSLIARHQIYPRGNHGAGRVKVTMVIGPTGELHQALLTASSGRPALDAAALRAVHRAAPFPPAPEGLPRDTYRFAQWMSFMRR